MNNPFLRTIALVALIIGCGALTACAATGSSRGTGRYIDDVAITTKVKAAVLNDPNLTSAEISVETFKGKVQLSGFVGSQAEIDRAVVLARGVKGVTSVINNMRVR